MNALVPGADEGRDKLRKATERSTYPLTRGYPNGATRTGEACAPETEYIGLAEGTGETETSKYPEEKKTNK